MYTTIRALTVLPIDAASSSHAIIRMVATRRFTVELDDGTVSHHGDLSAALQVANLHVYGDAFPTRTNSY